jgi:transcriptional regulator with XRE-family HTH domain
MRDVTFWILPMNFPAQLIRLRKAKNFTQQGLADTIGLHVNQVKKYEAGSAQPTLPVLVNLSKALHVSLDELVFDESERGPDDELRLQFEALQGFTPEEKLVAKNVLEGLILKHDANRFNRAS